jgi:adenylosuccinate synthase
MPVWVVVGSQWGDEGKGKVVDLLAEPFDLVARYQGGHNAGHTVRFGDHHFALHLIPSGILHPGKTCIIGDGLVVDPAALLEEIDGLRARGIVVGKNLLISDRAQVIFPFHRDLDACREKSAGDGKIGTTARGIGPSYEAKASRMGARISALLREPVLRTAVRRGIEEHRRKWCGDATRPDWNEDEIVRDYLAMGRRLEQHVTDTASILHAALRRGDRVLAEGAQGSMLDIDQGTYPFVTSSNTTAGGACTGLGVPPTSVAASLGIAKAYTTRVGGGPFPTELLDETGEFLRKRGNEYGTSTGRPRRCGWFDAVVVRRSVELSGLSGLALMKLDVLDEMEQIPVCVAYELDGGRIEVPPADADDLARVVPVYETHPGWKSPTVGVRRVEDLPELARSYVHRLETLCGVPIPIISTGPRREETILRSDVALLPGLPPILGI